MPAPPRPTPAKPALAKPAPDCVTMAEVRAGIDAVDAGLVALLVARAAYIDRAAVLKGPLQLPARIDWRVEEVVARVRAQAAAQGLDADLAEALWRRLIDWSVAREERVLGDERRDGRVPGDERRDEQVLKKDDGK